ncbi:MAG: hypothetical protein WCJ03_03905 [Bacteroidales bacterium]
MKKEQEKKTELFNWIEKLPWSKVKDVRRQIADDCEVTSDVVSNWVTGRTPVPKHQKQIINKLALEISGELIYENVVKDKKAATI